MPTIFLINDSGQIVELADKPYDSEALLQQLIAQYPSVLAGDQINGIAPVRWLLICREAGVPGEEGGSDRWALDHLFIDQDGVPTLVEVKRSTDTRIRREVVGQMLDYAANAILYWPLETIRRYFEERCRETDKEPDEVLRDFLAFDPAAELESSILRFWETVETNLRAGKIRLVFVADQIPPELRRVVEFLSAQMNPAEVIGVEIRQYVGSGLRTLVPTVIGASKRQQMAMMQPKTAKQWDRESFLAGVEERKGPQAREIAERIIAWAPGYLPEVKWGKGAVDGSFNPGFNQSGKRHCPFTVYSSGWIQIPFRALNADAKTELAEKLCEIPGVNLPDPLNRYPLFDITRLAEADALETFFAAMQGYLERVRGIAATGGA